MALKILLADDSLTAQKFGKEILVGAGHEVTAVSNGAAAAKKLSDPCDVYIFDMIMPGYTGLELCEKVRALPAIAGRPVLLTVGQMEHYDQNDVQRVRADGVIVKPFVKTDLEAIVLRFAAQAAAPAAQPEYEKTMIFQAPQVEEFKDESYAAWKTDAQEEAELPPPPAMVMSDEMGAAPAFFDTEEPAAPPPPPPEPPKKKFDPDETVSPTSPFDDTIGFPPPKPKKAEAPAADFGMDFPPVAPVMEVTQVEAQSFDSLMAAPAPPMEVESHMAPEAGPVVAGSAPDVEFTAAPKVGEIAVAKESALEAVESESGEPVVHKDPSLVTDAAEMAKEFTTKFGVEGDVMPFEAPIKGFEKPPIEEVLPQAEAKAEVDDFEARVAAAMSGYEEAAPVMEASAPTVEDTQPIEAPVEVAPMEMAPPVEEVAPEPVIPEEQRPPEGMVDAALVEQMHAAFADLPVEAHPAEETHVPDPAPVAEAVPTVAAATGGHDLELAKELAAAVGGESQAATMSGMDNAAIAQAVSKVMERMMPTLLAEVSKEIEAARKQ